MRKRMIPMLIWLWASTGLLTACAPTENDPDNSNAKHETLQSDLTRDLNPEVSQDDWKALIDGNHAFSLDIYHAVCSQNGNLMLSPYSIRSAFGLLWAGARNQTEEEIAQVLRYGLEQQKLHPAMNALGLALAERNVPADQEHDPVELHVANAFWGQSGYPWLETYLDLIALNYGAALETLDYKTDPEACRQVINHWVEDKTKERIKNLLPQGSIKTSTVTVLTNALYFKAPWLFPFEPALTSQKPFTKLDGSVIQVDTMVQTESFTYAAIDGLEVLEMPFRNQELSMVYLLPAAGTFDSFEAGFDVDQLDQALAQLEQKYGVVEIPKFTFESDLPLNEPLKALGMTTAFENADLSGMIENKDLFISGVFHKTFLALDEKGAEAAAATAIVVGETAVPEIDFEFRADRPFLFLIRDRITGAILFVGRLIDPTA